MSFRRSDISPALTAQMGRFGGAALAAASAWLAGGTAASAQDTANNYGAVVSNVATITYSDGPTIRSVDTNPAVFVIRPANTPAVIEFFRYSPTAPNPILRDINGSDFSPSGDLDGPYTTVGPARTAGDQIIDISGGDVPLIEADTYLADELMFVRVTDLGANMDSTQIDTISITLTSSTGDTVVLRLYESGPDTGEFFAYIPSTTDATPNNDNEITVGANSNLTATYVDVFDSTDVVIDSAVVNPLNRVFSSADGSEVPGAVVTLLNLDTGARAIVFGVDGFSTFPSEVTSGTTVTDSAGLTYSVDGGEFRYPVIEPGNYVLEVDAPDGFTFASDYSPEVLLAQETMNGFVLTPGSYGQPFSVDRRGPLRLDIPLDPLGELVVTKVADRISGDVGDYVNYTVTVDNIGSTTARATLNDILPVGFRYVPGTARLERAATSEPDVSTDAALLTFDMGSVAPGDSLTLDYALRIGPGAVFGTAVNEAVVVGPDGTPISNTGRAAVEIREDLLRTRSTIIGRVTEQSCNGDDGWARPIARGIGVAGVRMYMETGAYTVSDPDGLFHFEGVTEGTHVVQVDRETLPQGYELMLCEENTRLAGSMESQFVDVQGGGIWRTNFYLKQTGDVADAVEEEQFNDLTDYKNYDQSWLDGQSAAPSIAYPSEDRTPSQPATHMGIVHAPGQRVAISVNGRKISAHHLTETVRSSDGTAVLSRFKGVGLVDGRNVVVATVSNSDGSVASTLTRDIHYVKTIARITPMPDRSKLVADGRTIPEIAIRIEDEAGRPVHAGRFTRIEVEPPYRLLDQNGEYELRERSENLVNPLSNIRDIAVGADGILRVKLEPTLRTGKVTINATTDSGRIVQVFMNLAPEKRDWILVGLAEGTAAYDRVRGNATALIANGANPDSVPDSDLITDGRLAFFAKGMIKGEWLMTLSLDTDKRKSRDGSRADGDFLGEIDPNAYYTLYGDRSYQQFEGVSRYPVYLKLEKRQAYAVFGDFDTDITEGRLTAYNRRLSGLKGEYLGDKFQVLGFAAETNQGFAQDEIAADGTSGLYQLSNSRILAQSEEIVIETRDRVRPDVVLERRTLVRYLDYTLDYLTGELLFRLPVDATDFDFNPNVIVADYETAEDAERNITFGGRVQTQLAGGRVQIGSTFVREDGSALAANSTSDQIGVDAVVQVTPTTQARVEYAITDNDVSGTADATLVELVHTSERIAAEAYYSEQDEGFGLGQRTSNVSGVRRYGARAAVRLSESDNTETGERTQRRLNAAAYREENLGSGDTRDSIDLQLEQDGPRMDFGSGLRMVKDRLEGRDDRESLLVTGRASVDIPGHGATLQLTHEQPISGKDGVSGQPMRTGVQLTKSIGEKARVTIRHDRTDGEFTVANNTAVGVDITAWKGSQLTAATDLVTNDSGRRLGATVGLDQQFNIDENWSISAGVRERKILQSEAAYEQVAPDDAVSPFEINEDFTSSYLGLGYSDALTSGSVRGEIRLTEQGDTYIGSASVARSLSDTLSLAGSMRLVANHDKIAGTSRRADVRLGASLRPRDEDLVIFNRFDVSHQDTAGGLVDTKFVNNLAANTWINDRWQVTGNWGVKYSETDLGGESFDNWTNLFGAETRLDITRRIDLGLRGQAMVQSGTDAIQYSYGPSIGVSPAKNIWASVGYNVEGFRDDDFEAAEYSRQGPYVTLRLKFDQHTARGLLRRISPTANVARPSQPPALLSAPLRPAPATATAPAPLPAPVSYTCWDGIIVEDLESCALKPQPQAEPLTVAIAEPAPQAVIASETFICPDTATIVPDLSQCPAPIAMPRPNLNVCAKSSVAIFNVPTTAEFVPMTRLGQHPEFGDSHGLTPAEFFAKLDTAYGSDGAHAAYLDHLLRALGYTGGWSDARPDMFSDDVLPIGTRGIMGMGEQHDYGFRILPASEHDRQAFRLSAANGQVVHFMKSCGNYFYGCEAS